MLNNLIVKRLRTWSKVTILKLTPPFSITNRIRNVKYDTGSAKIVNVQCNRLELKLFIS